MWNLPGFLQLFVECLLVKSFENYVVVKQLKTQRTQDWAECTCSSQVPRASSLGTTPFLLTKFIL